MKQSEKRSHLPDKSRFGSHPESLRDEITPEHLFLSRRKFIAGIGAVTATVLLIDRIGRKPILMVGSVGMSLALATLVIAFLNATTDANGELTLEGIFGPLALVAANVYVVFFNFSWGPVMWVMLGEMFPNQIRGTGLAVSGLAQWGSNFGITMTFPIMLTSIGLAGAYGFYTLCAVLSIVFVAKMVHETRGVELEDMTG